MPTSRAALRFPVLDYSAVGWWDAFVGLEDMPKLILHLQHQARRRRIRLTLRWERTETILWIIVVLLQKRMPKRLMPNLA